MVDIQMVSQLWADVKYHVPTGIGFRRRRDIPLAYFQCNDTLLFVSKHAKGESTEKVKPTFRLKVNNGEIVVLPFFFYLS